MSTNKTSLKAWLSA